MRVESDVARGFYLKEASENNWSVRLLERNINTFYYQRLLSSGSDSTLPVKESDKTDIKDFIKDPYVFELIQQSV